MCAVQNVCSISSATFTPDAKAKCHYLTNVIIQHLLTTIDSKKKATTIHKNAKQPFEIKLLSFCLTYISSKCSFQKKIEKYPNLTEKLESYVILTNLSRSSYPFSNLKLCKLTLLISSTSENAYYAQLLKQIATQCPFPDLLKSCIFINLLIQDFAILSGNSAV